MAKIEVAKVEKKQASKRELYARLCYFYPQYTLQDAESLPSRDVSLLLKVQQKIEAVKMLNLTQIASAPNTKNGAGVKKLVTHFKGIANG